MEQEKFILEVRVAFISIVSHRAVCSLKELNAFVRMSGQAPVLKSRNSIRNYGRGASLYTVFVVLMT